ncbi:MAG: cobyric acid synthase CobQ, partial [Ferrovibrio sp.]
VVVRGQRRASLSARQYWADRAQLLPEVLDAFHELASGNDYILVEGAGSASEVNLRSGDIANFGFARAANVPVILIGDIHRGGVIASIVGTLAVIDPQDAALVRASLINKFFGDPALFESGRSFLESRTGLPCFGPVPHFADAAKLPAEDALALETYSGGQGAFHIAVPRLPRIANFDDLDPLRAEPGVTLTLVQPGDPIPRNADLVLLPG